MNDTLRATFPLKNIANTVGVWYNKNAVYYTSKARYVDVTAEYQNAIETAKALCNDKGKQALNMLLRIIKANSSALRGYEETAKRDDLALASSTLRSAITDYIED